MKKFLTMAVFALSVFILQMPQVEARDEYVGEWEGGWRAYLMIETVQFGKNGNDPAFSCRLKGISPQGTIKYFDYVFTFHQNSGARVSFMDSTGASGSFVMGSPGVYQVEHETALQLMALMKTFMDSRR